MIKKIIGIFLCMLFIGTSVYPVVGESIIGKEFYNKQIQNSYEHPDYYNVTIYRFNGDKYEEIIKQVSYDKAILIKKKYQEIEKAKKPLQEKMTEKNNLFRKYGILNQEDTLDNFKKEGLNKINKKILFDSLQKSRKFPFQCRLPFIFDFMGVVIGTFYGENKNFLSLGIMGLPLVINSSGGADILNLWFFMIPLLFSSRQEVLFLSVFFIGVVMLIPFIDPDGGEIAGISVCTFVSDQIYI